jgi:hypothetical protein
MTYITDARRRRVSDCKCTPHRGPCKCTPKRKPVTKDASNATESTVMAGVSEESQALTTSRVAKSAITMAMPGLQPAYTTKSSEPVDEEPDETEPESEEVKSEKTVADRIRQARDSRDLHTKNFLRKFYAARAHERSKRAS